MIRRTEVLQCVQVRTLRRCHFSVHTESIGRASGSGSKDNAEVLLNITFFYWLQKEAYEKI